ncbi:hypothetical protein [Longispora albida]|uniref:hypothetical protein n=1 Tax=Longispora albida TaxID=203523 RepID=UPI000365C089|nr:hypothetical protein [Longispora albida]
MSAKYHPVIPENLDPMTTGLSLCGPEAGKRAGELRAKCPVPVVADIAAYTRHLASRQAPLQYPPEPDGALFTLGFYDDLRARGVTVAATPTGYITGGDTPALKAARNMIREIGRRDVAALFPVDVAFLRKDAVDQLIAILQPTGVPIALVLGGQYNPTDRYADIVGNLRRVCREVPQLGVWRTDMITGFDCMAHGAMFTGVGASTTLRHAPPPDEATQHGNGSGRPSVLVPELWGYFRGDTLARRWANAEPLSCGCAVCKGHRLDRFDSSDPEIRAEALEHNVAAWSLFWAQMRPMTLAQRQAWLIDQVQRAAKAYPAENERIQQPGAFQPGETLKRMAKLAELLPASH